MATEKDKTIAKLYDDFLNDGGIATPEELYSKIWDAARADAIEECAQTVNEVFMREYAFNNQKPMKALQVALSEARSLSRKQEEPR